MKVVLWWLPFVATAVLVWTVIGLPRLAAEHRDRGRLVQAVTLAVVAVTGPLIVVAGPHIDPLSSAAVSTVAGASSTWTQHFAEAALIVLAGLALTRTARPHAGGTVLAGAAGFAGATGITFSATPRSAVLALLPLLAVVVFYFSAADWPATLRGLRWALRGTVWASLALGLAGPAWATLGEQSARYLFGIGRVAGVAGHPNALGAAAAGLLLLEIAKPRGGRWLPYAAVAAVTLILAESRTAALGYALGLLWMLAARRGVSRWLAVIGSVAVAIVLSLAPPDVGNLTGRTVLWHYVWDEFTAHPIFGYGAGFLSPDYKATHLPDRLEWAGQAHNQLLHTLAASGLVGGVALVVYLAVLAAAAVRAARYTGGATAGLLGLLVAECITETPLLPVFGALLLLHLGLLAAVFAGLRVRHAELGEEDSEPGAFNDPSNRHGGVTGGTKVRR